MAYRVKDTLNIRATPNGTIIGRLNAGAVVTPKGITGGWAQLGDGLFVSADWLIEIDQPAPPPPIPVPPTGWRLPFSAADRGVHGSAGGWTPDARQIDLVRRNNVKIVFIAAYEAGCAWQIAQFRQAGVEHFVFRACTHSEYDDVPDAATFVARTLPILKEYAAALNTTEGMMIAIGNEPNLYKEGLSYRWANGAEFAAWWAAVATAYRAALPGCKVGFPALSPGGSVEEVRVDESTFLREAKYALDRTDWAGVHWYWTDPNAPFWLVLPALRWQQQFGALPLVVTEAGPADASYSTSDAVRRTYEEFAKVGIPCMSWLLNGAGSWKNAAWDERGIVL